MSEQNKATLEKANLAITQGEYEQFLSYCTDDTEWTFVSENVNNWGQTLLFSMLETWSAPYFSSVNQGIYE